MGKIRIDGIIGDERSDLILVVRHHPEPLVRDAAQERLIKPLVESGDIEGLVKMGGDPEAPPALQTAALEAIPHAFAALAGPSQFSDFWAILEMAEDGRLPERVRSKAIEIASESARAIAGIMSPSAIEAQDRIAKDPRIPIDIRELAGKALVGYLLSAGASQETPMRLHRISTSEAYPQVVQDLAFRAFFNKTLAREYLEGGLATLFSGSKPLEGPALERENDRVLQLLLVFGKDIPPHLLSRISSSASLSLEVRESAGALALESFLDGKSPGSFMEMLGDIHPFQVRRLALEAFPRMFENALRFCVESGALVQVEKMARDSSIPAHLRESAQARIPEAALAAIRVSEEKGDIWTLAGIIRCSSLPEGTRKMAEDSMAKAAMNRLERMSPKQGAPVGQVMSWALLHPLFYMSSNRDVPEPVRAEASARLELLLGRIERFILSKRFKLTGPINMFIHEFIGDQMVSRERNLHPDSVEAARSRLGLALVTRSCESHAMLSHLSRVNFPEDVRQAAKSAIIELAKRKAGALGLGDGIMSEGTVKPPRVKEDPKAPKNKMVR